MMADLDDTLRADLARLRAQAGPSRAARQRMWTALEHQVGPGSDGDGHGEPDSGEAGPSEPDSGEAGPSDPGLPGSQLAALSTRAGFAAKVVAATLGLTGAGLLMLRAGVLVVATLAPSEPVDARHGSIVHDATYPDEARDSSSEPAEPTSVTSPPTNAAARVVGPRPARLQPQPAGPDPGGVENSLAAELALLQVAHDASSSEAALAALDEHLRVFPDGQLADERELMRVAALCALGRLDAARVSARALLGRHAAMTSRVHEVCPKLALDNSNDG